MKNNSVSTRRAGVILGLAMFYYVFLGNEYLFDNMIAEVARSEAAVIAQNYILGASVIGFLIFAPLNRWLKGITGVAAAILAVVISCIGIFVMQEHVSYVSTFAAGVVLFLILGIVGGGAHYLVAMVMGKSAYLARAVGTAYALGILMQFLNNNLIASDQLESIVLSVSVAVLVMLYMLVSYSESQQETSLNVTESPVRIKNPGLAAAALVIVVFLMTCVFSSLDNAVTLAHVSGKADIGQWPRLLLGVSGLMAGVLFDIKKRRLMNMMIYCVTLLSTICMVIIQFGGSFVVGLVVFYISAGFFVVFFTAGFMDLSGAMKNQALWAGMGRVINNVCALLIGTFSVSLLRSQSQMTLTIMAIVLFVLIGVAMAGYMNQLEVKDGRRAVKDTMAGDEEKIVAFAGTFGFTKRELEVFRVLLVSDDNIQDIADSLYISRAALYRHISGLNEKTSTSTRIGLLQFYYSWSNDS